MHITFSFLILSIIAGLSPNEQVATCDIKYSGYKRATIVFAYDNCGQVWPNASFPWFLVKDSDPNMRRYLFSEDASQEFSQELVHYLYNEPIGTLELDNTTITVSMSCQDALGEDCLELTPAQEEYIKKRLQDIAYKIIAVVEAHYNLKCQVKESEGQVWPQSQRLPPSPVLP